MASDISTSDINTAYPVAGVDNDSQGFRTNFGAIKTALDTAKTEIEELQSETAKVNATNDFNGSIISDAKNKGNYFATVNLGSSVSGSTTITFTDGEYQYMTTSGNVTLAFSGWPSSGNWAFVRVEINLTTGHTITLPTAAKTPDGWSMPTATGKHVFEFATRDGGTTIQTRLLGSYTS